MVDRQQSFRPKTLVLGSDRQLEILMVCLKEVFGGVRGMLGLKLVLGGSDNCCTFH